MEQYNFRLKEYRKIALKFYLAPWRVLVIDKILSGTVGGGLSEKRRPTSTRHKQKKRKTKPKGAAARSRPR